MQNKILTLKTSNEIALALSLRVFLNAFSSNLWFSSNKGVLPGESAITTATVSRMKTSTELPLPETRGIKCYHHFYAVNHYRPNKDLHFGGVLLNRMYWADPAQFTRRVCMANCTVGVFEGPYKESNYGQVRSWRLAGPPRDSVALVVLFNVKTCETGRKLGVASFFNSPF